MPEEQQITSESNMNKNNSAENPATPDDDMKPEYDFSGGVRGKHYQAYRQGHSVTIHNMDGTKTVQHFGPADGAVMLDTDLREYFPTSEAVNEALRLVIKLAQVPAGVSQS